MYGWPEANVYHNDIFEHLDNVNQREFLRQLKQTGVHKCVDGACGHIKGAAKPGSLWYENTFNDLTESFDQMAKLGIFDITAVTHLYCGLLAVVHKLYTVDDQIGYAQDNNPRIKEIALQSGVNVTWATPIGNGSANNYMNFMRSQS